MPLEDANSDSHIEPRCGVLLDSVVVPPFYHSRERSPVDMEQVMVTLESECIVVIETSSS